MATLKTQATDHDVTDFLSTITDPQKHQDCLTLLDVMREATGSEPTRWGSSMIGFGRYRYTYATGHSGETFITGFAARKQNITLYIMSGFDQFDDLLRHLGTYKTGKACLYIKRLADVDLPTLKQLISASVAYIRQTYPDPGSA